MIDDARVMTGAVDVAPRQLASQQMPGAEDTCTSCSYQLSLVPANSVKKVKVPAGPLQHLFAAAAPLPSSASEFCTSETHRSHRCVFLDLLIYSPSFSAGVRIQLHLHSSRLLRDVHVRALVVCAST